MTTTPQQQTTTLDHADVTALDLALTGITQATAAAVAEEPSRAAALFSVQATNPESVLTRVRTRGHSLDVDEPGSLGGEDTAANPVEHALAALASCQVVTYRFVAAQLGIRVDGIDISVEGDLDVRGFFGLDPDVRPGFGAIRFHVELTGPESPERYEELRRTVDQQCPVLDLFANSTPVTNSLSVSAG